MAILKIGSFENFETQIFGKSLIHTCRLVIAQLVHSNPAGQRRGQFNFGQQADDRAILLLKQLGCGGQGLVPVERRDYAGVEVGLGLSHVHP